MTVGNIRIDKDYIKETLRYILFGLTASMVSYICYFILTRPFNLDFFPATMIACLIANTYAFFVNHQFVFIKNRDKNEHDEISLPYFEFVLSRLLNCFLESLVLTYFIDELGYFDFLVKAVSGTILGIINYVFTKMMVFGKVAVHKVNYMKLITLKCSKWSSSVKNR